MPDYLQSKIYTIRFINEDNHIYIGSTTQPLVKRFGGHKFMICSLYRYIQDVYNNDWSKCYIELYEEFKCDNKEQLNKREGEIIRDFMNNNKYIVINKRIAGRTNKEYHQDNKENILTRRKKYYENNKEEQKQKYQKYKDTILKSSKKYYEDNKQKALEYAKQYYQKTKESNRNKKALYMREYRLKKNA